MQIIENILKIENLYFNYGSKNIFDDFSLTLKKGEIKSILGQSGSGKSTLFELICGNLKPKNGVIETQNISIVYQDPYSSFHPSYSIIEQIKDLNFDLKDIDYLIDKLTLQKELLDKKPHQLSGGQLQRCSILRALLAKPDLLLIDEPTSALDNIIAYESMKILIDMLDEFGILLITHDEDLASWCSDEIVRL
jgi:peptide/nickel transport system ATP-binding protein